MKKLAFIMALSLLSFVSCSDSPSSAPSDDTSLTSEETSSEEDTTEVPTKVSDTKESSDTEKTKDENKYNTYSMEELFGKDSPLLGYWHTEGRDMYIEYDQFGGEGFTVFILGTNLQIFSSEIGIFSGTPQNVNYMLASSVDDKDVANLFNKDTAFSMAVNDDNSIAVFLNYGYDKTSTYTFQKTHPSNELLAPFMGQWGDGENVDLSFAHSDGDDIASMLGLFGFSSDLYPIGIPSVYDNECWLCCPYSQGMLTPFSDYGVFYDVIYVHMVMNPDGTLNVTRTCTNPILSSNSLNSSSTLKRTG